MGKKILYLVGTGRSGTTLFDIIFGNSDNVFSGGELRKFIELRGDPHGYSEDHSTYLFWRNVANKFFQHSDEMSIIKLDSIISSIEYHKNFFNNYFSTRLNNTYKNYITTFYKVLFNEISEEIIVDSSKYPGRALALYNYLEYEIFYINIKRNPIDIINSFQKKNIEQPSSGFVKSNFYIAGINLCTKLCKKRFGEENWISIYYDEFLKNPIAEIKKIELKSGIDLSRSIKIIKNNGYFKVGYLFEGNRIRLKNKIKLKNNVSKYPITAKNIITKCINGWT